VVVERDVEREVAGELVWLLLERKNVRISMLLLLMPLRRFVQEREGAGDGVGEEEEENRMGRKRRRTGGRFLWARLRENLKAHEQGARQEGQQRVGRRGGQGMRWRRWICCAPCGAGAQARAAGASPVTLAPLLVGRVEV
jgi:hypothetical protein